MATIVLRSVKGSALTFTEMDDNLTNLNTDKLENITGESINDLSNVDTTGITNGQALLWDSATSKFIAGNVGADLSTSSINDLSDVNTSGVADGDILSYDSATSNFVASTPSSGGGGSPIYIATMDSPFFAVSGTYTKFDWDNFYNPSSLSISVDASNETFTVPAGDWFIELICNGPAPNGTNYSNTKMNVNSSTVQWVHSNSIYHFSSMNVYTSQASSFTFNIEGRAYPSGNFIYGQASNVNTSGVVTLRFTKLS